MTNRFNNPVYIGQTADKASKSHGATNDGMLRSSGGPHHPMAGGFEEPSEDASRLQGVMALGNQYKVKIDKDGDYDNGKMMNESNPTADAI